MIDETGKTDATLAVRNQVAILIETNMKQRDQALAMDPVPVLTLEGIEGRIAMGRHVLRLFDAERDPRRADRQRAKISALIATYGP